MKVAIVCRDYPPAASGLGDHTYFTAREMAARGIEVSVLTSQAAIDGSEEESFAVRVVRSDWDGAAAGEIVEMLTQDRPDVVVLQYVPHMYGRSGVCPWVVSMCRRIKDIGLRLVTVFHELYYPLALSKRLPICFVHRYQAAALMSAADVSVVTTPRRLATMRRWLPRLAHRMVEIPVGSNIPVVDAGPDVTRDIREKLSARGPLIGGFGILKTDERNPALLFDVIARLRRQHAELRFVWIGSADRESRAFRDTLARAREFGVEVAIACTGALDRDHVSRHLSALDLFFSFQDDGPCFRRGSLVAAMAHRLPIIALDGHSTDARLENGRNMLIMPRSAAKIAEAADRLLRAPVERRRLGEAVGAFHDTHLSWDLLTAELVRVCER
jgi:glycosyltransferase involved in cell wall biosynthesis